MFDRNQSLLGEKRAKESGNVAEIINKDLEGKGGLLGWWHRFTSPPDPGPNASFRKREIARRGKLISTILFILMLILLSVIPVAFINPTKQSTSLVFIFPILLLICGITLFFNRKGATLVAGLVILVFIELGFVSIFAAGTGKLDLFNLPLFDLMVEAELLAISLLPARSIFIVALFHCIVIWSSLRFLPHTGALDQALATNGYALYLRPISLQIIVAVVAYLWANSSQQALKRADRAEVVAHLEHAIAEQKTIVEAQKQQLEENIQHMVQIQAEFSNGNLNARVPLPESKLLWPLATSLNHLFGRLRRSYQAEYELAQTQRAIAYLLHVLQESEEQQKKTTIMTTGTAVDSLIVAISKRTPNIRYIPSVNPTMLQSGNGLKNTGSWPGKNF